MHYLVTGHTGFKGAWLTLLLLSRGHRVSGLAALDPPEGGLFQRAGLAAELWGGGAHWDLDGENHPHEANLLALDSEVAQAHGVSWPTAHRAFVAHAEAQLSEPEPVAVLGIDETRRGKPRWERCATSGRWVRVGPVGHRVCRSRRRSGPVGAAGGPQRCGRGGLAERTHPGVS